MEGWISLHRKIQDSPIYTDSQAIHLWIHLLLKANHQQKSIVMNGKKITIDRGQILTGRRALSSETGINESKIQRLLKLFEDMQMIEQQTNSKNRLISITKYNSYQSCEQQVNNKRTANEQQMNTNNNVNNDNKVNNVGEADAGASKKRHAPYAKIAELYNEVCTNLPKVKDTEKMSDKRKRGIKKFWDFHKDNQNSEFFADYFKKANEDSFLTGHGDRGWKADLDYLMRPNSYEKIMEK